ncbi:hypothetical protein ACHAW6_002946 [Cyclotella cf. meneghiniana]
MPRKICNHLNMPQMRKFERTGEGWFKPKFGHEEEMQYRVEMKKRDYEAISEENKNKEVFMES